MSDTKPDKRTGDRRKGDDPAYEGEERREGERREEPPEPPKPS